MATRPLGKVQGLLELVVASPLRATLSVGSSILILLWVIELAAGRWPELIYLRYVVPFIPPFFITRTARRINQRTAEYDFIRDAEPYIFVAFPAEASVSALLAAQAAMTSDSAVRHFQCAAQELMSMEALPAEFFNRPGELTDIAQQLVADFQRSGDCGVLSRYEVHVTPRGKNETEVYLLNSVLKTIDGRLKWQATMMGT